MGSRIEILEKENQQLRQDLDKIRAISKKKNKRRRGFLKLVGFTIAGKRLKKSIYNVLDQYGETQKVSRDVLSEFFASVLYRITRIGLFTVIFALLPSILLVQQNILLKQQNRKIQDQNFLAEASRRSGQMFIMGDVLSDINSERKLDKVLSSTLIGRITSLSRAMKPYRYFENGILIQSPLSPERGQLLVTISKSNLTKVQLSDDIFQNSDFTYAELKKAHLDDAYFKEIDLSYANLQGANLVNTNFSRASLKGAILSQVDLTDSNLKLTDLSNTNLRNANLRFADLKGADLSNAIMDSVRVHRIDWLRYIKDELRLKGAKKLYDNYKVDSLYFEDLNKKVPTLIKD